VTVKVGTTVKWTNNGPSAHTATGNTGMWGSGQLSAPTGGSAGGTYQYTFTAGGYLRLSLFEPSAVAVPWFHRTVTVTS